MANVVGVKPMRWSTRLGMIELKKVSSTRCAEAVAGASRKAAMIRAGQRIKRVDQRVGAGVKRVTADDHAVTRTAPRTAGSSRPETGPGRRGRRGRRYSTRVTAARLCVVSSPP